MREGDMITDMAGQRSERKEDTTPLALKMEERTTSQGLQVISKLGEAGKHSSLEPVEGVQLCRHLDFSPDFCQNSIKFVVMCYSSSRKQI